MRQRRSTFAREVAAILGAAAGIALLLGGIAIAIAVQPSGSGDTSLNAVIVDQLAATDPNPALVTSTTRMLKESGYTVDYVPSDRVSVAFYAELPKMGYELVVLRSHALQEVYGAAVDSAGNRIAEREVGIFTNEPYSPQAHVDDQRSDRLTIAAIPDRPERYFAIGPAFVRGSMRGRFSGTTLILLGCGGLNSTGMAQAFKDRGVETFISWDDRVTAQHNDAAAEPLLRYLVMERMTPRAAVLKTMADVGPDPIFASTLVAFP